LPVTGARTTGGIRRAVGICTIDKSIAIVVDTISTDFSRTRIDRAILGLTVTVIRDAIVISVGSVRRSGADIAAIGYAIVISVVIVIKPGADVTAIGHKIAIGIEIVIKPGADVTAIGHNIAIGIEIVIKPVTDVESVTDTIRICIAESSATSARSIADISDGAGIAIITRGPRWSSGAGSSTTGGIRSAIRIGAVDEIIPIVVDAVVADFSAKHLDGATYGRTTDTQRLDTDLVRSWRKDRCLKDC
jgi:hypothetical protein